MPKKFLKLFEQTPLFFTRFFDLGNVFGGFIAKQRSFTDPQVRKEGRIVSDKETAAVSSETVNDCQSLDCENQFAYFR